MIAIESNLRELGQIIQQAKHLPKENKAELNQSLFKTLDACADKDDPHQRLVAYSNGLKKLGSHPSLQTEQGRPIIERIDQMRAEVGDFLLAQGKQKNADGERASQANQPAAAGNVLDSAFRAMTGALGGLFSGRQAAPLSIAPTPTPTVNAIEPRVAANGLPPGLAKVAGASANDDYADNDKDGTPLLGVIPGAAPRDMPLIEQFVPEVNRVNSSLNATCSYYLEGQGSIDQVLDALQQHQTDARMLFEGDQVNLLSDEERMSVRMTADEALQGINRVADKAKANNEDQEHLNKLMDFAKKVAESLQRLIDRLTPGQDQVSRPRMA